MQSNINCSLRKFSVHVNSFSFSFVFRSYSRFFLEQSGCSCKYRLELLMCTLTPLSLRQNTCQMGSEGYSESLNSTHCGAVSVNTRIGE